MLGFNGFERHFVEMVAEFYSGKFSTIMAMRGVSRAWRAGSKTQWDSMKVKWVLSTAAEENGSLYDITIFEKDASVLKTAILNACKYRPQIIIGILKALVVKFKDIFAATLRAANDGETKFDLFQNEDEFCLRINFKKFDDFGRIQLNIKPTANASIEQYSTINLMPSAFVCMYKLQCVYSFYGLTLLP